MVMISTKKTAEPRGVGQVEERKEKGGGNYDYEAYLNG